jgi:hypothetical protein
LKIGYAKPAFHIGSFVVLWEILGDYHRRWWPGYTLPWSILSYASLVWWRRVELKNAQNSLSRLQRMTCLGITGGMAFNTNVSFRGMLMLPSLHLFIKQESRQVANRLLGNGCSYVPNFGHLEVLIKMTDKMPLLLAPRDS